MRKLMHFMLFFACVLPLQAQAQVEPQTPAEATDTPTPGDDAIASAIALPTTPDSAQLEKALQQLNWEQFKSVIKAIPKLKAEVDAYGPLGWQYVEANYQGYGWKKSIDKLDDGQKKDLANLIRSAKNRL